MRLDHDADDPPLAARQLRGDVARHVDLALVLLRRIGVRAVDHQALGQACARQLGAGGLHARRVVVRLAPAAQDDVAVLVARVSTIATCRSCAPRGSGASGAPRAAHRPRSDVAVGAVLEADRGGQSRGELAVHLALGGARANRTQETRSPMYCGEITSRNSQPAGTPAWLMRTRTSRAMRRPSLMRKLPLR